MNSEIEQRRDEQFERLVSLGMDEAKGYADWLSGNSGEALSPFAIRGLAHTFGHVIARTGGVGAEPASEEQAEETACTCGAGHGSLEGHTSWCAWLDTRPKDFDTWWSADGQYLDPDTSDVPWFDKRRGLAEYAFIAGAASSIWPDFIAPPKHDNAAEGWTDPDLPDFRLIWQVAHDMGYAIGLHGSMKRDCDLIAAPWVEAYATPGALIEALCSALNAREVGPREPKPNGRIAVNLQIDGWFRVIDLSIASASPAIPADHVVVPREPTEAMSKAGNAVLVTRYAENDFGNGYSITDLDAAYRAMLAAAPSAPTSPPVGDGWRPEDFAQTASDMRSANDAVVNAAMSNGFNVILAALDRAVTSAPLSGGLRAIAAERQRQVSDEGWTPAHDDAHSNGELAAAAACYAVGRLIIEGGPTLFDNITRLWPWSADWWKPTNRRRDLVKAGALILAEIDRLDRIAPPSTEGAHDGR